MSAISFRWGIITKQYYVHNMRTIGESLFWLKMASAFISLILLVAVIRLIILIDYFSDKRDYGWRIARGASAEKKRSSKQWKGILELVKKHTPLAWKEAVQKADAMVDEVLKAGGYAGNSIDERLMKIDASQIAHIDEIRRVRKEVFLKMEDEQGMLDLSETKKLLRLYRDVLRQFGMIE